MRGGGGDGRGVREGNSTRPCQEQVVNDPRKSPLIFIDVHTIAKRFD